MKKLLILPLLMLLTSCVTYYYPETAYEDGVYYAEDDPSYAVYSDSYAGAAYYPWSSIDFFYTGYYPYSGLGYHSGFSFGFSYSYSPWYYPYYDYGYYYPSHRNHYWHAYNPYSRPYQGYCSGHYNCGKNKNHNRGDKHDRYAGGGRRNRDREDRNDEYADDRHPKDDNNERDVGRSRNASVRRYVSTPPSGHSSNRGMVIRNNESTKISKSRLEPDKTTPVQSATTSPSVSRTTRATYDTSGLGNNVRYRSDTKQSRSKTGPVNSGSTASGINIVSAPSGKKAMTAPVSGGNTPATHTSKRSETPQRPPSNTRSGKPGKSTSSNSGNNRSRSAPASSSGKRQSKGNHSSRRQRRD